MTQADVTGGSDTAFHAEKMRSAGTEASGQAPQKIKGRRWGRFRSDGHYGTVDDENLKPDMLVNCALYVPVR